MVHEDVARSAGRWIAVGAVWAGLAVLVGAFGAHGLEQRLAAAGHLETWQTAVRYQVWHALALILFALFRDRTGARALPAWGFFAGSVLFSGSIYLLCLDVAKPVMGPLTPLGGLLLIASWVAFAVQAWRTRPAT